MPGRKTNSREYSVQKNICLTPDQGQMLEELATEHNKNHSQLFREWLEEKYKEMNNIKLISQVNRMELELRRLRAENEKLNATISR
jgi:predicted DNA-binding protein